MKKRSIVLNGHETSVTLEDAFWDALKVIAAYEQRSISAIVCAIDNSRFPQDNLSSHIRLYILKWYQNRASF